MGEGRSHPWGAAGSQNFRNFWRMWFSRTSCCFLHITVRWEILKQWDFHDFSLNFCFSFPPVGFVLFVIFSYTITQHLAFQTFVLTCCSPWGNISYQPTSLPCLSPQGPPGPQGPTGFPGPKGPPVSNSILGHPKESSSQPELIP